LARPLFCLKLFSWMKKAIFHGRKSVYIVYHALFCPHRPIFLLSPPPAKGGIRGFSPIPPQRGGYYGLMGLSYMPYLNATLLLLDILLLNAFCLTYCFYCKNCNFYALSDTSFVSILSLLYLLYIVFLTCFYFYANV